MKNKNIKKKIVRILKMELHILQNKLNKNGNQK